MQIFIYRRIARNLNHQQILIDQIDECGCNPSYKNLHCHECQTLLDGINSLNKDLELQQRAIRVFASYS